VSHPKRTKHKHEIFKSMTTIKEDKFVWENGDYDYSVTQRIISGKFNKKRRKLIEQIARHFTYKWSAPYGRSNNGYALTCGHIHDCCGCLTRKGMDVEFKKWGNNHVAILKIRESRNF